jgi:nitroreductase
MDVYTAISQRRSVRAYKDRAVEDEKLNKVLDAARLAPSASNRQEWKFVVVCDKETRERLSRAALGQTFVAQAPVVIVACATEAERVMACGQSAYTVDVSIACAYMTLQACELGLGTCWLGAFHEHEVKDILKIPGHIRVVTMLPLGYPDQPVSLKSRKGLDKIVCYEKYE